MRAVAKPHPSRGKSVPQFPRARRPRRMLALGLASAALSNRYMPFLFWARKRQLVRHSCPADRHASRRNRRPTTEWGLFFSDAGGVDCRAQCRGKQDSVSPRPATKPSKDCDHPKGWEPNLMWNGPLPATSPAVPAPRLLSPCSGRAERCLQMSVNLPTSRANI